ncbi:MAG: hypothetical protein PHU49_16950, partial [Syntrophorhabdaceae bacterium]|nr:hypothetical protein [Syntrophorhabdaceae bacterium]
TTDAEPHDAILQRLDRKVGKLYFNKEPFIPTVDRWNNLPIVFAKKHLDPLRGITEAELAEINGAIIGDIQDSKILIAGGAKLEAKKVYSIEPAQRMFEAGLISQDTLTRSQEALPYALKLNEEGKLSHSTAFICPDDGTSLYGEVLPHHVLDFEETATDKPVDPGAVILNKEESTNVTPPVAGNPHTNIGKAISAKNKSKLQAILDSITAIWQENFGEDNPTPKTNAVTDKSEGTMNTPGGESLERQIETVRQALSGATGLRYPDGTPRNIWTVMTLPDQVIWQHPDTSQYFSTPYTMVGETVTFGTPVEVEQAYVVKQAGKVITNMTAEDLDNIAKRNKMADPTTKTETDAAIAKLQKERDDALAAKDVEIAKLQKERDDLKAEQEKVKLQKEESDWIDLKKSIIPPGLVKDPKDEADLRKLQKEDNSAFLRAIVTKRAPGTKQEGQTHVQKAADGTETPDTLATVRELRSSTGRMR